ncbi:hypothetical protein ACQR1N_30900 [Bradyrhizobium sp. HKCCYLRH1073]|uniref:hypothetical protein n=1 Tax=unclassified Bradyrhizobium TaxID=2631580 RepID=UPI002916FA93|nr:hypothetical protein [Bradyrhizobium sp. SZCCHNS3052]
MKVRTRIEAAGGRARVTTYVTGQAANSVQRQFEAALHILHYWRDDAAHGQETTITDGRGALGDERTVAACAVHFF